MLKRFDMSDEELFYRELTRSSEAFVSPETQLALRDSLISIFGLGSVGSSIALGLTRAGAGNLLLTDPDEIEPHNLSRQYYKYTQIGWKKAEALARNLRDTNPYMRIHIDTDGLVIGEGKGSGNVRGLVEGSKLAFDAIDMTALPEVYALHEEASNLGIPVSVGYDLGGSAFLRTYRYDEKQTVPLNGAVTRMDVEKYQEAQELVERGKVDPSLLTNMVYSLFPRLFDLRKVPLEQLLEALTRKNDETRIFQDSTAPLALSALSITVARRILSGEPVAEYESVNTSSRLRRGLGSTLTQFFLGRAAREKYKYERHFGN